MNSNDIIHMAREAGIDAHIKVGAAELERFAALVAAAAPKQTEADHLKLHAIEELCQLGYTVKDGELFPPDHLHKLIEAAGHPLAVSTQDEAVRQPAALKDVPEAMNAVIDAMQADPDYAWSWHCNVAMAFVDAGGDPYTANQGAARFMRLLANVDPAHELPPQQAEAVPTVCTHTYVLDHRSSIEVCQHCGAPKRSTRKDNWQQYAKEGENAQQCIERHRKEQDALLELLRQAKQQAEAVPTVTPAMVDAYLKANDAYWKRTDDLPKSPAKWRNGTPAEATRESLIAALAAAPQPKEQSNAVCRSDGKCQYAIDHDAEKLGHCPTGKCVMPRQAETALQPKGGV